MENHHLQWIFPLKIVIFHSYVSLPEGMSKPSNHQSHHQIPTIPTPHPAAARWRSPAPSSPPSERAPSSCPAARRGPRSRGSWWWSSCRSWATGAEKPMELSQRFMEHMGKSWKIMENPIDMEIAGKIIELNGCFFWKNHEKMVVVNQG